MATTYDKASLVMIPSGVKESKLYSIKPTDGSGDFTFSRGTDTATRVNASGLIEKERGNLLLQSNTFSNAAWVNTSSTETGGQSGYDGSNDAWLLSKSALAGKIRQNISLSGVKTFSLYTKANASNWIAITFNTAQSFAYFDLSSASLGSAGTEIIDHNIESVGSDWYRVSLSTNISMTAIDIYVADADNDVSGTSGSIFIQDAQIEQGLVATDYIETTTAAVYEGITDNLPRLDYSGGASCPSLLLEPSRTNVFTDSEYFNGTDWILQDATITTNVAISPEGVQNASLYTSASDLYDFARQNISFVSGTTYTYSVFAKAGTSSEIVLGYSNSVFGNGTSAVFNLSDGTYTKGSANPPVTMEDYGNGWWRCSVTATATITATRSTGFSSAASGAVTTLYLYGAQMEASASYPTSYIPTYGTSASRADDDMETGTLPAISGGEVSFFLDIDGAYDPNTNSTGANFQWYFTSGHWVAWNNNTSSDHRIRVTDSGGNEYFTLPANRTERCKVVVLLSSTNVKVISNGVIVGSRTISADWSTTNGLFTAITDSVGVVPIKQCLLFPTRLTDAECIALTTI